jgi:hypothetical protein
MSVAPADSRLLPAASSPSLETSSCMPLVQLPTDNEISCSSDTLQLSADNETLSAALSLSLLSQPANGKSRQSLCSVVQIFWM